MAAYGALVSLMHIIDRIQNHPRLPISLNKEQVESLTEMITFLQDFLEVYNSHGGNNKVDDLRRRITDAAYAAEDIIEAHVVYQILAQPTSTNDGQNITSVDLYQDPQKVIQGMDSLEEEAKEIIAKIGIRDQLQRNSAPAVSSRSPSMGQNITSVDLYQDLQQVMQDMAFLEKEAKEIKDKIGIQDQLKRNSAPAVSSRSPFTGQNIMVGFDNVMKNTMEKLMGHQSDHYIIPIVGMGGIGKTTLARNLYEDQRSVDHFDCRAWVTLSEEYNAKEILSKILSQVSKGSSSGSSEKELGEKLHKSLFGRRYLVVLDDIWGNKAWEDVKFYLQDNNCGSRIIVTTRISDVAMHLTGTSGHQMNFLDDERSWELLRTIVFGDNGCPPQFKKIGKEIAKNCKGLPLSITVIGGLLAKSNGMLKDWVYVAENLNSVVSLRDDERCFKILHTSYDLLPVHLKPCFLYMGTFPEDSEIRVSQLIKLWIVEGFLKQISGKSFEVAAQEYLKDLIDRNLIIVRKWGSSKVRSCNIHDLLREICLKEAQKDKFLCATIQNSITFPGGMNTQPHVAFSRRTLMRVEIFARLCRSLQVTSPICSLVRDLDKVFPSLDVKLLSVQKKVDRCLYDGEERYSLDAVLQLVNSRYLAIMDGWNQISDISFSSSIYHFWNLQMLIGKNLKIKAVAPTEIWKMPQLRHVEFYKLYVPDPPSDHMDEQDDFVLGNLQTLSKPINLIFGKEVVKRIPNVKKLKISYEEFEEGFKLASHYCLDNLGCLHELESLACSFSDGPCRSDLLHNLTFPRSLKKLTLYGSELHWEDMSTRIGSLPLLEVLKLKRGSFIGRRWETVESQFLSLRVLVIDFCVSLRHWTVESTHFPRLECLVLRGILNLKEIPSGIGETLKSIHLDNCSDSAVISARKILDEQEEFGTKGFQVTVRLAKQKPQLQILASHNFQVKVVRP